MPNVAPRSGAGSSECSIETDETELGINLDADGATVVGDNADVEALLQIVSDGIQPKARRLARKTARQKGVRSTGPPSNGVALLTKGTDLRAAVALQVAGLRGNPQRNPRRDN